MLRQGLPDGDGHNSTPEKHAPSLRLRLAASLTAATLAVALVSGLTAWLAIHNEANDYQDDILRQTATLIDPHNPPRRADLDDDNRIDIEAVARTGRYGRFLGKNPHDGYHDLRRHDRAYRAYIHTYPGGERLALIQDTESRDEIASASAWHAIAPLLLLVPILALTSLYTIHRALRPVRRLSRDIEARDENDLSPLADSGVPQELRGITRAMNRLLARIDSTIRREQRFIADAAHELRTPMTALTLQAERLAPHLADSIAARAQLHTLRDGIRRTSALLEQLLLLARSQHSETAAPAASHVQTVFRQVIETLLPLADAKQSDLGIASDADATLPLPAAELYTLIKNLADNALRYSLRGSRIDLDLETRTDAAILIVEDNGPGIAPDERARVLDPFYRQLGSDEEGTGLGLAIVKTLCDKYGASLTLHDARSHPHGLRVEIRFPCQIP